MITDTMGEARVFGQKLINLEASVQLKDRKANNTEGAVWQSAEELLARAAEPKNSAFLFLKPHAATPAAKALVETELAKRGIAITKQGELDGATIDSKKHIDKHYYSIASKATLLKPEKLPGMVAHAPKFEAKFGLSWADALTAGKVFNAEDACKQLSLDADGLDAKWAAAKKGGALVKFGGGFYCAELDGIYVLNGFFMAMRSKYTVPTAKIYYFAVEWEASECSWDSFRSKVLGPTDPAEAPADSLRGIIAAQWEMLGLPAACDVGDNGVHASASPFEALVERSNWLTSAPAFLHPAFPLRSLCALVVANGALSCACCSSHVGRPVWRGVDRRRCTREDPPGVVCGPAGHATGRSGGGDDGEPL